MLISQPGCFCVQKIFFLVFLRDPHLFFQFSIPHRPFRLSRNYLPEHKKCDFLLCQSHFTMKRIKLKWLSLLNNKLLVIILTFIVSFKSFSEVQFCLIFVSSDFNLVWREINFQSKTLELPKTKFDFFTSRSISWSVFSYWASRLFLMHSLQCTKNYIPLRQYNFNFQSLFGYKK